MQTLQQQDIKNVVGGEGLIVTQNIPTIGMSQRCVNSLPTFNDYLLSGPSEEQFILKAVQKCSIVEVNKLLDRIDFVVPTQIELL